MMKTENDIAACKNSLGSACSNKSAAVRDLSRHVQGPFVRCGRMLRNLCVAAFELLTDRLDIHPHSQVREKPLAQPAGLGRML